MLTDEQLRRYREDGFVVVPGFASKASCEGLRARTLEMVADFDPVAEGVETIFSTTDRSHAQDEYFLTSGDKIRFFFEDGAFDPDGTLNRPLDVALNKMGHAMHDLDPVFSAFSRAPGLSEIAAQIGFEDPRVLQSMYIFKPPSIGGEVVWHVDHTFLWTNPKSVVGFWFAIEDATIANGCMWAIPGAHHLPPKARFRREGAGTTTDVWDPTPWPDHDKVPLEAEQGTLVVFDGLVPHWSGPNTSAVSRHAYTVHAIDGTCEYPEDNWLHPNRELRGFGPDVRVPQLQ